VCWRLLLLLLLLLLQARSGDYLAKVAWLAGIPVDRLLLDNTAYVNDLDSALQGTQLMLCNPKQGGPCIELCIGPCTAGNTHRMIGIDHQQEDQLDAAMLLYQADQCCRGQ
jgi:hypothetical protein